MVSPQMIQPAQEVDELLHEGYTDVVDADLSKYCNTIPHSERIECLARRIVDEHLLENRRR
jgi:RNA-directed DNA polymerase